MNYNAQTAYIILFVLLVIFSVVALHNPFPNAGPIIGFCWIFLTLYGMGVRS